MIGRMVGADGQSSCREAPESHTRGSKPTLESTGTPTGRGLDGRGARIGEVSPSQPLDRNTGERRNAGFSGKPKITSVDR